MHTLGQRIYALIAALLAGLALTVGLSVLSTGRLVTATEQQGRVNLASIELIQAFGARFERRNSIVTAAPAEMDLAKAKERVDEFRKGTEEATALLGRLAPLATDPEMQSALVAIQKELPAFATGAEKVFMLGADFLQSEAVEALQKEVSPVQEQIRVNR